MKKRPIWPGIIAGALAVICAFLLCLILLEMGLRLAGSMVLSWQEHKNRASIQQKGAYRIMCVGESTTAAGGAYSYPSQLQEVLNQRGIGVKFSVINEGVPGIHTSDILDRLEPNLDAYHPDMVISMMGSGDLGSYILYEPSSGSRVTNFFRSLRIYKLARIFWLHIAAAQTRPALPKRPLEQISAPGRDAILSKRLLKLEQAAELSPRDDRAYFELGAVYERLGRYPEAEAAFKKSVELNPWNDRSYLELGWIFRAQGKLSESEALFKKAKEIDPKNYWPYVERGRFSEAEVLFKNAIARDPGNDWLYIGLGWIYRDQDKLLEAAAAFKKGIEINPRNNWLYLELGSNYQARGRYYEAEALFNKAAELNPQNARVYFELGWVYEHRGRYPEAEAAFKKVIGLRPRDDWPYLGLGRFYLEQGKFPESAAVYNKAIELDPANDLAYVGLGQACLEQDRLLEAGSSFKKALELNPKNDWPYIGLGWVCQKQGNFSGAEAWFTRAIEVNPLDDWPYVKLGSIYRLRGKSAEAAAAFKKAAELNPRNDRTYRTLKVLYMEIGDLKLAREYERKANELNSNDYPRTVIDNYHKVKEILNKRGIVYVCAQYPLRDLKPLKAVFQGNDSDIIFVDNQGVFQEALKRSGYNEYFTDMCGGDFGHCTPKGNRLLAENMADVILEKVFLSKHRE
jgi:tetratricopeptide (TPR) repeat protein